MGSFLLFYLSIKSLIATASTEQITTTILLQKKEIARYMDFLINAIAIYARKKVGHYCQNNNSGGRLLPVS